ncbi:hypothetical protein FHR81_000564 [Actinoalloteichus hoggarensis]|uniref:Uncharacterized protein n=1 Tax=Actinoalloteichus hoggarensis TaxID=1470176 RepID=A0A221W1W3_9PSEU|nr:hypothetical protein AHOG_10575 [Actinoalloteichus hoggarensis]MBB5919535.1 hypothetical protein [Actinoalloteichus hoggarensis]
MGAQQRHPGGCGGCECRAPLPMTRGDTPRFSASPSTTAATSKPGGSRSCERPHSADSAAQRGRGVRLRHTNSSTTSAATERSPRPRSSTSSGQCTRSPLVDSSPCPTCGTRWSGAVRRLRSPRSCASTNTPCGAVFDLSTRPGLPRHAAPGLVDVRARPESAALLIYRGRSLDHVCTLLGLSVRDPANESGQEETGHAESSQFRARVRRCTYGYSGCPREEKNFSQTRGEPVPDQRGAGLGLRR